MHLDADLGFQVTDGPNATLNGPSHFPRSNDGLLIGAVAQGDQCAAGLRPKRSFMIRQNQAALCLRAVIPM